MPGEPESPWALDRHADPEARTACDRAATVVGWKVEDHE
jgi:hypothetical protein